MTNKYGRYWALAAASVAVVVFGSAQATGALWRDQQTIAGGTINSGTLDIKVGQNGAEVNDYVLAALGSANLGPNGFSQAPLSIRNAGNVPFNFRLQGTTSTGTVPLALTVTTVVAESNCPATGAPTGPATVLYTGNAAGAQTSATGPLAAGARELWCFRLAAGVTPPQSASSTVTFSFRADQT
ncbi:MULTISPECIES: hypothetical protein [Nocardiaceae]|uniref:hypothetical protein n=1 Tax=Nocardiaceae TaxID=85025 RepID=UPI00050CA0D6|nr:MULTISPECIES: hypothetical protein [Rhodococcus]OZC47094.1 hypothetical protein CH286_12885 [Rhodococcus sp. WWJCD1]OZE80450.1 hypothetical protein CH305_12880 [Rhodococcus sp. 15-649-2-2]